MTLRELLLAVRAHARAAANGAETLPDLPKGVTDAGGGKYDVDVLGAEIVQADVDGDEVELYYDGGTLGIEEDDVCPVTLTRVTGLTNEGEELELDAFEGFAAVQPAEGGGAETGGANPTDGSDGNDKA